MEGLLRASASVGRRRCGGGAWSASRPRGLRGGQQRDDRDRLLAVRAVPCRGRLQRVPDRCLLPHRSRPGLRRSPQPLPSSVFPFIDPFAEATSVPVPARVSPRGTRPLRDGSPRRDHRLGRPASVGRPTGALTAGSRIRPEVGVGWTRLLTRVLTLRAIEDVSSSALAGRAESPWSAARSLYSATRSARQHVVRPLRDSSEGSPDCGPVVSATGRRPR